MKKIICKLLVMKLLLTGCAAYYPQLVDIPLIEEKGDIRLNTGCFIAMDFEDILNAGVNGTFSAGVTDMLAVQGYASLDALLRWHFQGALGIFNAYENNTVIEMYAGYGLGTGGWWNMLFDFYDLCFMQFNIGQTNAVNGNIDFGMGLKGGYVFYDYTQYNMNYEYKMTKNNSWIIEPSMFVRFGGKHVKMNIMVNYLWADNIPKPYYFPVSVGMGVNFKFGNSKKESL